MPKCSAEISPTGLAVVVVAIACDAILGIKPSPAKVRTGVWTSKTWRAGEMIDKSQGMKQERFQVHAGEITEGEGREMRSDGRLLERVDVVVMSRRMSA